MKYYITIHWYICSLKSKIAFLWKFLSWRFFSILHQMIAAGNLSELYPQSGICEYSWWRHPMETFSALLAISAGNSPVTGEYPPQRPVTRSFDVFFDPRLNKRLINWWFKRPSRPLWRACYALRWFPYVGACSPGAMKYIDPRRCCSSSHSYTDLLHFQTSAILSLFNWFISMSTFIFNNFTAYKQNSNLRVSTWISGFKFIILCLCSEARMGTLSIL